MRLPVTIAALTVSLAAAGCVESGTSSHQIVDERELAELDTTVVTLSTDAQSLWLTFEYDGCASLAGTVNARLDGRDGITYRYAWETTDRDFGHSVTSCQHPRIGWPLSEVPDGPLTFEVFDGTTDWLIVTEGPRTARWLEGAAAGATLRSGQTLTVEVEPAPGPLLGAGLTIDIAGRLQRVYPSVETSQISFTVPEVTAESVATLDMYVQFELPVLECSGPAACEARGALAQQWSVLLTP